MYGAPPQHHEQVLFTGPGVQVTTARFVVGHQTYPIANITSVSPFTVKPARGGAVVGILLGAGMLLFAVLVIAGGSATESSGAVGFGVMVLLFGLFVTGMSVWAFVSKKPAHGVAITTSGMNVQALTSANVALVHQVLGALNQALSMR